MTIPKPFNFELDQRLEDRKHYNELLKKKQRAADERERVSRAQREREEQRQLKEYRKSLEFKVIIVSTHDVQIALLWKLMEACVQLIEEL